MSDAQQAVNVIEAYAQSIKGELLRPARGILRRPYLSPGIGDTYPDLTDWDTIWSGIAYAQKGDVDPLKDSLLNLIEHIAPDGKGQRRIGFKKYSAPPYQIRPFLASGVYALSKLIGCDWLSESDVENLHRHLIWWHVNRTGREGLLKWLHVDEGFADNGLVNWAWEGNAVQGTDLNAQMVREHIGLAWVLEERGDEKRAAEHREWADRLCSRIETCLWNEELGCYASLYNPPVRYVDSEPIPILGYNNLWPLWVGISSPERAKTVIEKHLLNEDAFLSPFGIRSMAKCERNYNNMKSGYIHPMASAPQTGTAMGSPSSNWQGPVWAPSTYCGIFALKNYGYAKEADDLATRYLCFLEQALARDGAFYENYDAETGEGLHAYGMGSWYTMLGQLLKDEDVFPSIKR